MKATVDKDGLLAAVQAAASALPGKSMKPVLDCVRIHADQDRRLMLAGTDCEAWMEAEARGAEPERPGEAFVVGKKLAEVIGAAPRGPLLLEAVGSSLEIRSPASSYVVKLNALDGGGWPGPPGIDGDGRHELCAATLAGLLKRTLFAAATGGAMAGLRLELAESGVVGAAGCDARRAAYAEAVGTDHGQGKREGTLPAKAAKILAKLLKGEDPASVRMGPSSAIFAGPGWSLASLLVEGRFPDWRAIITPSAKVQAAAVVSTAKLAHAARQAMVLSDSEHRCLSVGFGPSGIALSSASPFSAATAGGEASSGCELESYKGKAVTLLINGEYLREAMDNAASPRCEIAIQSPLHPVMLRFSEQEIGIIATIDPPKTKAE